MKIITRKGFVAGVTLLPAFRFTAARAEAGVSPAEARAIAKEAYIYGFPVVDNYRIQNAFFVDKTPKGVTKVFRSETEFVFAIYRTQVFSPDDLDNVTKIQAGYKVQPLSAFLGQPAPAAAPAINFIKPLTPAEQRTWLEYFNI